MLNCSNYNLTAFTSTTKNLSYYHYFKVIAHFVEVQGWIDWQETLSFWKKLRKEYISIPALDLFTGVEGGFDSLTVAGCKKMNQKRRNYYD